jgi:hypothetical protein
MLTFPSNGPPSSIWRFNLKAAKSLYLTVPVPLLSTADEVIE